MKNRVLRDYSGKNDGEAGDFGLHLGVKLDGNANFTSPPLAPMAITLQATGFNTSVSACVNGTPADTLLKNTLRAALMGTFDILASYVDLTAKGDAQKILSSGFSLASTTRNTLVPGMTSISSVTNVGTGKLGVELQLADNAWAYIVEYTALPNGAVKTATFTNSHEVTLAGLIPGTIYSIRVQVMGSGNQVSEWCDMVQHMAT